MALSYEDLLLLNTDEWQTVVEKIHGYLKPQLQKNSFISHIKDEYQEKRKSEITDIVNSFTNSGSENLDIRILNFTDQLKGITDKYQTSLKYDFINIIKSNNKVNNYLDLCTARDFLQQDYSKHALACERLSSIILEITNQSMSQGDKANAGMAGENMVRAIFNSMGLVDKIHYRDQYKSKSGSDTDFVLPNVEDFNDILVDAYVAVQFSTNDRARLASSELKEGGVRYFVTGNGLPASKKTLKDIGSQIIQNFVDKRIRLVCYEKEIEREKSRIKENLNPDYDRLEYFETSVISFSIFADRIKHFKDF
jgi:hypothetical protein